MDLPARIGQLRRIAGRSSITTRPDSSELWPLFSALQDVVVNFPYKNHISEESQEVLAPLLALFGPGTWQQQTAAMLEACKAGSNEPDYWNKILEPKVKAILRFKPYGSGRYGAISKLAALLYAVLAARGLADPAAGEAIAIRRTNLAVSSLTGGHLEVWAVVNGNVLHTWRWQSNGWHDSYSNLTRGLKPVSSVAVARPALRQTTVMVLCDDGSAHLRTLRVPGNNVKWTSWRELPCPAGSTQLSLAPISQGRLIAWVIDDAGRLWRQAIEDEVSDDQWVRVVTPLPVTDVSAAQYVDGHQEVFITDVGGSLHYRWGQFIGDEINWQDWQDCQWAKSINPIKIGLSTFSKAHLGLTVLDGSGTLSHSSWEEGRAWSEMEAIVSAPEPAVDMAVGQHWDDVQELFMIGSSGSWHHAWLERGASSWHWTEFAGPNRVTPNGGGDGVDEEVDQGVVAAAEPTRDNILDSAFERLDDVFASVDVHPPRPERSERLRAQLDRYSDQLWECIRNRDSIGAIELLVRNTEMKLPEARAFVAVLLK